MLGFKWWTGIGGGGAIGELFMKSSEERLYPPPEYDPRPKSPLRVHARKHYFEFTKFLHFKYFLPKHGAASV